MFRCLDSRGPGLDVRRPGEHRQHRDQRRQPGARGDHTAEQSRGSTGSSRCWSHGKSWMHILHFLGMTLSPSYLNGMPEAYCLLLPKNSALSRYFRLLLFSQVGHLSRIPYNSSFKLSLLYTPTTPTMNSELFYEKSSL